MKKLIFSWFIIFSQASSLNAQMNLIQNPSFEDTVNCPSHLDEVFNASHWSSARPSPDYFNICAGGTSVDSVSVPSNVWGYQFAASGSAYVGLAAHYSYPDSREFISSLLNSPLQIGTTYYVSFKLSLFDNPNSYRCAVNKIGALFTMDLYSETNPAPICNCSQVYTDSIISDSIGWSVIFDSFVADSSYIYINLGNFFDDSHTDSVQYQGTLCQSYYYLDDVCVSTDSIYTLNYTYTDIKEIPNISNCLYPNPFVDKIIFPKKVNNSVEIELFDILGQIIHFTQLESVNEITIIPENIKPGIYLMRVTENGKTISLTFIKP